VLAVERLPESVFVGTRSPEGAVAWLTRPIDPMRVLRELDVLAGRRMSQPAAQPRADAGAHGGQRRTVIQPVRPQRPDAPADLLASGCDATDAPLPHGALDLMLPDWPAPAPGPGAGAADPAPAAAKAAAMATTARSAPAAPRAAAQPVMVPRAETSPSPRRAEPPSTALLVDDSELALRFLQKKLAPYGLITECVANSEAAMKRLAQRRYDFVFLDMELGERSVLDGLALCQRIKQDAAAPNVVMVTAHHTELDRVRAALAGCDGFLGKPLDEEELALYLERFGVRPAANAGRAAS
jgi:CheY-like chemotaxis protein